MNAIADIDSIIRARSVLDHQGLELIWNNNLEYVFNIIFNGNWRNENQLLRDLCNFANNFGSMSFGYSNTNINLGIYCTHQKYIGRSSYVEFGDLIFVTLINDKVESTGRFGYVNAYQFKVGPSYTRIIRRLDANQLGRYLKVLTKEICHSFSHPDLSLLGDFMYYWFIMGQKGNRKILEIPLSVLWLERDLKYFRYYNDLCYFSKTFTHGWSVFVNNIYLVTGIEVSKLLPFSKPSLEKLLKQLINQGVNPGINPFYTDGGKFEDDKKYEKEGPINGKIVIAIEIEIRE